MPFDDRRERGEGMSADKKPLPTLVKSAITREQLRAYAEASLDHNPIHLDDAVAKKSGLPGVIAHGMLTMAFMGEFLHQALDSLCQGKGRIEETSCRFKAMTFPGDVITISGSASVAGDKQWNCDIEAKNQNGEITATGHALISGF